MPRVVAIIQARLSSTRLPNKVLMNICGKPMLERVIEKVRKSKLIDTMAVASPHPIVCSTNKFIGDEEDVLKRYYDCATHFMADTVVRITSDCPLLDPEIIDYAIRFFKRTKLRYVYFAPVDGLDVEVFTYELLKEAHQKATKKFDREHVTPYMKRVTKISVDTLEELNKVRRIYEMGR